MISDTPLGKYFQRVYQIENIQVNENPITATVNTTATKILQANDNRLALYISNLSANFGYAAPSDLVSATYGFYVGKSSGQIIANVKDDGPVVTKPWYALNDTAQGTWYVVEVVAGI